MSAIKGKDPLTPGTSAWDKRMAIHHHNGFKGHARMMTTQAHAIATSPTVDDATKQIAWRIHELSRKLSAGLNNRVGP